ncbi:MAG: hypothetical protein U0236_07430 [Nitrospira sp.]
MTKSAALRIYCIPAMQAPVVAVFRRGPSNWSHVGRWDLAARRYEPGAWLGGRLFPRRSDLSPDGRYLCYFAHKPSAAWEHGDTYVAISRLPWLTSLHAFGTRGTWTRGYCFTEDDSPDHLLPETLPIPYGLRAIPVVQFANERRQGWIEAEDSPIREPTDLWDERRHARMRKPQPYGDRVLCVESLGVVGVEVGVDQTVDGLNVQYALESDGNIELLDDVQWADWSQQGHLLVATRSGRLQIRMLHNAGSETLFEADLSQLEPNPTPAPVWVQNW